MQTHPIFLRRRTAAAGLVIAALCFAAEAQDRPKLEAMIEAALPSAVGNATAVKPLLSPRVDGRPFSSTLSLGRVGALLGDQFATTPDCNLATSKGARTDSDAAERSPRLSPPDTSPVKVERCLYRGQGSYLNYESRLGRIDYLNPTRAYVAGVPNTIAKPQAQERVLALAAELGVPKAEVNHQRVRTLDRMLAASPLDKLSAAAAPRYVRTRIEVHTRLPRRIGGLPVLGSRLTASLDAKGQIAALHASWPDFVIAPQATKAPVRTRSALANAAARTLEGQFPELDRLQRITASLVYVDINTLRNDEERVAEADDTEPGPSLPRFVPAVRLRAIPVEVPDSDTVSISVPVVEIIEPLVDLSPPGEG